MAGKLKDVTDETFEQDVLENGKTVLVDFWAEWCGPCRIVAPELEKLAAAHPDGIEILQLDIEANPRMRERYRVMSIPMLNVYRDGDVVKTIIGAKSKEALELDLAHFLG
jgi:thioredoxin 1